MKFKIGDRVKIYKNIKRLHHGNGCYDYRKDNECIGIVKEVLRDGAKFYIDFPFQRGFSVRDHEIYKVIPDAVPKDMFEL